MTDTTPKEPQRIIGLKHPVTGKIFYFPPPTLTYENTDSGIRIVATQHLPEGWTATEDEQG